MSLIETVDLFTAWEWICPECGTNHFASSVEMHLPDEEMREMMISFGDLDPHQELPEDIVPKYVSQPETVTCPDCKRTWTVTEQEGPGD